jgi:hypothetical protein
MIFNKNEKFEEAFDPSERNDESQNGQRTKPRNGVEDKDATDRKRQSKAFSFGNEDQNNHSLLLSSSNEKTEIYRIDSEWKEASYHEEQEKLTKLLTYEKEFKVKIREKEKRMRELKEELKGMEKTFNIATKSKILPTPTSNANDKYSFDFYKDNSSNIGAPNSNNNNNNNNHNDQILTGNLYEDAFKLAALNISIEENRPKETDSSNVVDYLKPFLVAFENNYMRNEKEGEVRGTSSNGKEKSTKSVSITTKGNKGSRKTPDILSKSDSLKSHQKLDLQSASDRNYEMKSGEKPDFSKFVFSKSDAEKIKNDVLNAFKERMIEKAKIIQNSLEKQQNLLANRQFLYKRMTAQADTIANSKNSSSNDDNTQRLAGQASQEETEEFERISKEILFRIDILNARRIRHEEIAMQNFIELERKLRNDPRLVALNS